MRARRRALRLAREDARGSILPLMLVCLVVLVLVGFACVDAAGAYVARAWGRGVAQVASSETSAHTLQVKTSDNPLGSIGKLVTRSLASNGFSGSYRLRVYEPTRAELEDLGVDPDHDRLIGVSVDFDETYSPLVRFDLMGFDTFSKDVSIPIHRTWVIHPFASTGTIYRPASASYGGEYSADCEPDGSMGAITRSASYSGLHDRAMPDDLRSAILVEARGGAG